MWCVIIFQQFEFLTAGSLPFSHQPFAQIKVFRVELTVSHGYSLNDIDKGPDHNNCGLDLIKIINTEV